MSLLHDADILNQTCRQPVVRGGGTIGDELTFP